MTLLRFTVVTLVIGLWLADRAQADSCGQALAKPKVEVQTHLRPVVYDFEQSLRTFASNPDFQVSGKSVDVEHTLGLTKISMAYEWSINFNGQPRPEGGYCWSVKDMTMTIFADPKVFIGKEIPQESCVWREVMIHEMRHVRIDQQLFPLLADQVRPHLLQAASRTIKGATGDAAKAEFASSIGAVVDSVFDAFLAKRNKQQLTIDTPEEYERFGEVCGEAVFVDIFTRAGLM